MKYTKETAIYNKDAISDAVDNAAKTATNYISSDVTNGLVVGNQTASTLGGNVQLVADPAVNLRNGATVLASFKPDEVELGKNSESSVIKLCGGSAFIKKEGRSDNSEQTMMLGTSGSVGITANPVTSNPHDYRHQAGVYASATEAAPKVELVAHYDNERSGEHFDNKVTLDDKGLKYNEGYIYAEHELYNNADGTTGTVPLSEHAGNFKYMEFHYKDSAGFGMRKFYNPNGKTIFLETIRPSSSGSYNYPTSAQYVISGTAVTLSRAVMSQSNSTSTASTTNQIRVHRVVGYK